MCVNVNLCISSILTFISHFKYLLTIYFQIITPSLLNNLTQFLFMVKNYSSLNSNTTLEFNKKETKNISSGNDFKIMNASWFFMILMLISMTIGQKATANHTTNLIFTSSYTYHSVILKSSVDQGQSGGGGHGNTDWVGWHPLMPNQKNLSLEILIKITTQL